MDEAELKMQRRVQAALRPQIRAVRADRRAFLRGARIAFGGVVGAFLLALFVAMIYRDTIVVTALISAILVVVALGCAFLAGAQACCDQLLAMDIHCSLGDMENFNKELRQLACLGRLRRIVDDLRALRPEPGAAAGAGASSR